MRLCLVSSILALIVAIHFQSQPWLLVLWPLCYGFYQQKIGQGVLVVAITLATTIFVHAWLDSRLHSRLPAQLTGVIVTGVGITHSCDTSNSEVEKLILNIVSIDSLAVKLPRLKKLELSHYLKNRAAQDIKPYIGCGKKVAFKAKLRAPYTFLNPYGFDYEAWQLSRGIDAGGYFLSYEIIANDDSIASLLDSVRQRGIKRAADLPGVAGQIVPALLFGESSYLQREYWQYLQVTGTIHLLVVSGLHVGFLVMILSLVLRYLVQIEMYFFTPKMSSILRLTPLILLLACLIYSYMAGAGLAVLRASLMFMVAIFVSYYKGSWSLFDSWLWVAWLVLIINPMAPLFVGFWFSFAAVGFLLMGFAGHIRQGKKTKWIYLQVLLKPQWIVFIALMPLLWMFQQSTSLLSFVVNIIAIPALGLLILPLSLLSYLFPEGWPLVLLNPLLDWGLLLIQQLAQYPAALVYKPSGIWLVFLLPLVFATLLFNGLPFRRLSLCLLVLVFFIPNEVNRQRLVVLDVGQGLSVLGVSHTQSQGDFSWLYDTGAKYRSGFSLGEAIVAKNILALTDKNLELLFVSHSDNDHAGGEAGLRRKVGVVTSYAGQPRMTDHQDCHKLTSEWVAQGGVRWRTFNVELKKASDNDLSCIVQIEMAGKRILIPGDIEKRVESKLVELFKHELKSDILIVPHHGSRTSSSEEFVSLVAPSIAIVSSGFKNRFNHPHPDVVATFHRRGVPLFNSANSGAVEIEWGENASVIEWRKENPPIWRQM